MPAHGERFAGHVGGEIAGEEDDGVGDLVDARGAPLRLERDHRVEVAREGDLVLVTTDGASRKARNLERDPRVALSIVSRTNPYEQLLVRGRVVEVRDDPDLALLDALSQRYTGAPFPRRRWRSRVVFAIAPHVARYYLSPLADTPASD